MSLHTLPPEMLVKILTKLDLPSAYQLGATNRYLHNVFEGHREKLFPKSQLKLTIKAAQFIIHLRSKEADVTYWIYYGKDTPYPTYPTIPSSAEADREVVTWTTDFFGALEKYLRKLANYYDLKIGVQLISDRSKCCLCYDAKTYDHSMCEECEKSNDPFGESRNLELVESYTKEIRRRAEFKSNIARIAVLLGQEIPMFL